MRRGRGRPRFWTNERREELVRLMDTGWSAERMAAYFGKTIESVRMAAKTYGLTSPEDGRDRVRGFSVPQHMDREYQLFRKKLGSATEAGRVLGLIEGNP